jgi:hypothetical protein
MSETWGCPAGLRPAVARVERRVRSAPSRLVRLRSKHSHARRNIVLPVIACGLWGSVTAQILLTIGSGTGSSTVAGRCTALRMAASPPQGEWIRQIDPASGSPYVASSSHVYRGGRGDHSVPCAIVAQTENAVQFGKRCQRCFLNPLTAFVHPALSFGCASGIAW